jgi:CMP-N-acetylneuraminic acid synthetase
MVSRCRSCGESMSGTTIDLAIIPARGGSVGLPGKNIRLLGGYPLIAWTIRAAIKSDCFSRVIVSTDSEEIAAAAVAAGAEVPFLRPAHLSVGSARSADVVRHALQWHGSAQRFALMQPTSPFRSAKHIKAATALLAASGESSLVSVCAGKPLQWSYHLADDLRMVPATPVRWVDRRQDARPVFNPNGAIYVGASSEFLAADSLFLDNTIGFEMDRLDSLDIDDLADFELASAVVDQGLRVIDP